MNSALRMFAKAPLQQTAFKAWTKSQTHQSCLTVVRQFSKNSGKSSASFSSQWKLNTTACFAAFATASLAVSAESAEKIEFETSQGPTLVSTLSTQKQSCEDCEKIPLNVQLVHYFSQATTEEEKLQVAAIDARVSWWRHALATCIDFAAGSIVSSAFGLVGAPFIGTLFYATSELILFKFGSFSLGEWIMGLEVVQLPSNKSSPLVAILKRCSSPFLLTELLDEAFDLAMRSLMRADPIIARCAGLVVLPLTLAGIVMSAHSFLSGIYLVDYLTKSRVVVREGGRAPLDFSPLKQLPSTLMNLKNKNAVETAI